MTKIADNYQKALFPEAVTDNVWEKANYVKRYYLSFPFYPFRTLCPRYLNMLATMGGSAAKVNNFEFDPTSPMIPANTQINIVFNKRNITNFLPYMLPYNLDGNLGTSQDSLSQAEKLAATKFSLATVGENRQVTTKHYHIKQVAISIKDIYLQVHPPPSSSPLSSPLLAIRITQLFSF